MATNTTVLIVVTALAAVVLVGVPDKTRTGSATSTGETIRDQAARHSRIAGHHRPAWDGALVDGRDAIPQGRGVTARQGAG